MSSIFNYQTFDVRLEKQTRTLWISLNRTPEQYITNEMLFELESLFAWCTGKVEIHSIVIQSRGDRFSEGINPNYLKTIDANKLESYTQKLQKINFSLMHLPQIIIADLGLGCDNTAAEFATACDIRISHENAQVSFDHAQLGFMPSSGGISQLGHVIGQANARNWLLTGCEISSDSMLRSGFTFFNYNQENHYQQLNNLLQNIHDQAPVQRIQTKMGVTEQIRSQVDNLLNIEKKISQAANISEDWKEKLEQSMPAKNFQQAVKLSLVKDDL